MNDNETRGGRREGSGRKKIDGVRHCWTVPTDIHHIAEKKGVAYLWEAIRFKEAFDKVKSGG